MRFTLSIIALTFLLTGCDFFGTQYVYKPHMPGEMPAVINAATSSASEEKGLFSPNRTIFAKIYKINDSYAYAGMNTTHRANADDIIQLPSGATLLQYRVDITVSGVETYSSGVTMPLNVVAGEHYTVGVSQSPPVSGGNGIFSIWIQNSAGQRLTGAQLKTKRGSF